MIIPRNTNLVMHEHKKVPNKKELFTHYFKSALSNLSTIMKEILVYVKLFNNKSTQRKVTIPLLALCFHPGVIRDLSV